MIMGPEPMIKTFLISFSQLKYIFGIEYKNDGKYFLPYSDIEKTFIDMGIFRQKMSPEILNKFREKINQKKLKVYLKKYSIN